MTIQQLYDKALEEGRLNNQIWLYGETGERPLEESDVTFGCLHFGNLDVPLIRTVNINTKMK